MHIHYLTTNCDGELTTTLFATYDECLRARHDFVKAAWKDALRFDPFPAADYQDDEGITEACEDLSEHGWRDTYTFGSQDLSPQRRRVKTTHLFADEMHDALENVVDNFALPAGENYYWDEARFVLANIEAVEKGSR